MRMMSRLIEKALYAAFPDFVHPCLKEVIDNKKNMMKKTANFLLNAFEKRLQRGRLLSYPYFLTIDPTNICHLQSQMPALSYLAGFICATKGDNGYREVHQSNG
jgi:hypothetical protein